MANRIILLGVSGCGKSFIGEKLANALGYPFFDGDDFHSEHNITKMQQGKPLTDEDRQDWLATLNQVLINNKQAIIACSALKPTYRKQLTQDLDDTAMVYLKGDMETIWQRHQKREGHFFTGQTMLQNQFDTLIEPTAEEAFIVDVRHDPDSIVKSIMSTLF